MLNRYDFRCVLKVENVPDGCRSTGRLFQARGPTTVRALSPMVERRVAGAPELQPWMQNVVDGMSLRWEQCDFSCQSVTPFSAQALSLAL